MRFSSVVIAAVALFPLTLAAPGSKRDKTCKTPAGTAAAGTAAAANDSAATTDSAAATNTATIAISPASGGVNTTASSGSATKANTTDATGDGSSNTASSTDTTASVANSTDATGSAANTTDTTSDGSSSTPVAAGGACNSKSCTDIPSFAGTWPAGNKRGTVQLGDALKYAVKTFNDADNIKWLGDYYHGPPADLSDRINFVSQIYHFDSVKDQYFEQDMIKLSEARGPKSDKYLTGYGEAGGKGADAAADFKRDITPLGANFTLVAPPSLSSQGDWDFLGDFLDACTDCGINTISFHLFGGSDAGTADHPGAFERLQGYVDDLAAFADNHTIHGMWVENMQVWGSEFAQMSFLAKAIPYLESHPRIQRYAYVSPSGDDDSKTLGARFWDSNGELTNLGKFYSSFPADGSAIAVPADASKSCDGCTCKVNPVDGSC